MRLLKTKHATLDVRRLTKKESLLSAVIYALIGSAFLVWRMKRAQKRADQSTEQIR